MSTLKHATGDLLEMAQQGQFDIIIHGCNCQCRMGAGIAAQIKRQYPEAYDADCETTPGVYETLGNYTTALVHGSVGNVFTIVNAYTQFTIASYPGEDVFEYYSFGLILQKLAYYHKLADNPARYGLPYIGMGLAGGNQAAIMRMIESFSDQITLAGGSVTLVEFAK